MGKKKIDKLKLIESKLQRNVAFCKRKRGFLKKAIELSSLCDQQILIVIFDKDRNRLVQFSSDSEFQFQAAYKAYRDIKVNSKANQDNYEKFTNDDYENLEKLDFRSVRYKKKDRYGNDDEVISEFEEINLNEKSQAIDDAQSVEMEEQSDTLKSVAANHSLQQASKQSSIPTKQANNNTAVLTLNLDESSKQVSKRKTRQQQMVQPQQQQPPPQIQTRKREQKQQAKSSKQNNSSVQVQNYENNKKICLQNEDVIPQMSIKQADNMPTKFGPLGSVEKHSQLYDQIHEQKIEAAKEVLLKQVQSQSKNNSPSSLNAVDEKTPNNDSLEIQSVKESLLAALKNGAIQNLQKREIQERPAQIQSQVNPLQVIFNHPGIIACNQVKAQEAMKIPNSLETQQKVQAFEDNLIENQILDILWSCDDIQNIKIPGPLLQKLTNKRGLESYLKSIIFKQDTLKKELDSKEKKSNEAYQVLSGQQSQKNAPLQQQSNAQNNQYISPSQNQQSSALENTQQIMDPMQVAIKKCSKSGGVNSSYVVEMLQQYQDEQKSKQILKQIMAQQTQQQLHNNQNEVVQPKIICEMDIEMHKMRLQQQCQATVNAKLNHLPASKELFDEQSDKSLSVKQAQFLSSKIVPNFQRQIQQIPSYPVNQTHQGLHKWPSMQLIPPSTMALRKMREIQRTIMQPIPHLNINGFHQSTMDAPGPHRTERANSCVFKPHQIKSPISVQRPLPKKIRENYSVMSNLSHTKKNDLVSIQVHANKGFLYQDAGAQSVSHMSGLVQAPKEPAQSVYVPSKSAHK